MTPVELIDKAVAIASRPEAILCSFGDMVRVPGTTKDLLTAKAEGGDVRILYSPLDAVEVARRNPDRQVVFFAVGFETTAPATAMAVQRAKVMGLANFSLLVSHVLVPPAMEAILRSPGNRVQGFLAAGHVCAVMGYHEYPALAQRYRVPIVVTGFEPVDILQGVTMCVRQLEAGRHEVENQYVRSVRREGNLEAQRLMAEVFRVIPRQWRGIGEIAQSGLGLTDAYSAFDAEPPLRGPRRHHRPRVAGVHQRPDPDRSQEAGRNARPSPGAARPSSLWERPWSRPKGPAPPTTDTAASHYRRRCSVATEFALQCPMPKRRHERVLLAHGGGGRLMRDLIEGVFLPAFANPLLGERHDGAVLRVPAREGVARIAFTTDSYVVRPLFFPGGDIGTLAVYGTVNDLAMCGARPLSLSAAFILEEGLPFADLERVAASMRQAADAAGVQIVTGDTKVVEKGKGDGLFVNTAGVGRRGAGRAHRAERRPSRGPHPGEWRRRPPRGGDPGGSGEPGLRDHDRERLRAPGRAGPGPARGRPRRPLPARPDAGRSGGRPLRDRRRLRAAAEPRGGPGPGP